MSHFIRFLRFKNCLNAFKIYKLLIVANIVEQWYCCGVEDNSWGLYRQSEWYNRKPGEPGVKGFSLHYT